MVPACHQHFPAVGHLDLRSILPDILQQLRGEHSPDTLLVLLRHDQVTDRRDLRGHVIAVFRFGYVDISIYIFSAQDADRGEQHQSDPHMPPDGPDSRIRGHHGHGKEPQDPVIGSRLLHQFHPRLEQGKEKQDQDHRRGLQEHQSYFSVLFRHKQIDQGQKEQEGINAASAVVHKDCQDFFHKSPLSPPFRSL